MSAPPQRDDKTEHTNDSKYQVVQRPTPMGYTNKLLQEAALKVSQPYESENYVRLAAAMSARPDTGNDAPIDRWMREKEGREIRIRNDGKFGARIQLLEPHETGRIAKAEMHIALEGLADPNILNWALDQLLELKDEWLKNAVHA